MRSQSKLNYIEDLEFTLFQNCRFPYETTRYINRGNSLRNIILEIIYPAIKQLAESK